LKRVAFIVHTGRPEAVAVATSLSRSLHETHVTTRRLLTEPIDATEVADPEDFAEGVDLIVSVGGDGTFLRSAQIANERGCPVVGVMVGRLGFLTEIEPEDALQAIEEVLAGSARIEKRMALVAESDDWPEVQWALNEMIIEKGSRHRLIKLAVMVGGTDVCTFSADGVIVSTSTGSTAYSFSARGPIVSPQIDCLVVTPIAAHMVFDRSLVVAPSEGVSLEVVGEEPGLLSADGNESHELPVGSVVRISPSPKPTLMVRGHGKSFFAIVRQKFGLPGDPA